MSYLNRLLTPDEAAQYLGLTVHFLAARRSRGDGPPYVKIAHSRVRYRISELDVWAEKRIKTSTGSEETDR